MGFESFFKKKTASVERQEEVVVEEVPAAPEAVAEKAEPKEFTDAEREIYNGMTAAEVRQVLANGEALPEGTKMSLQDGPERTATLALQDEISKKYAKTRVTLFDRVLDGAASEAEMQVATEYVRHIAANNDIAAFSFVPASWYSNPDLVKAMKEGSGDKPARSTGGIANADAIDMALKRYTPEQLRNKGFEALDPEAGVLRQYSRPEKQG